jgi:hypothetical protein
MVQWLSEIRRFSSRPYEISNLLPEGDQGEALLPAEPGDLQLRDA